MCVHSLWGVRWSTLVQPENVRDCESLVHIVICWDLDLVGWVGELWCTHLEPKLYRASGFVVIHSSIAADPETQEYNRSHQTEMPTAATHEVRSWSCCPHSRPHPAHTTQTRILTHTFAFWIFKTAYSYIASQPLPYTITHSLPIAYAHHTLPNPKSPHCVIHYTTFQPLS